MGYGVKEPLRPRRLRFKVLSHGLELSAESENLLEEAMARLNVDDPDEAVQAALRLFLTHDPPKDKTRD